MFSFLSSLLSSFFAWADNTNPIVEDVVLSITKNTVPIHFPVGTQVARIETLDEKGQFDKEGPIVIFNDKKRGWDFELYLNFPGKDGERLTLSPDGKLVFDLPKVSYYDTIENGIHVRKPFIKEYKYRITYF